VLEPSDANTPGALPNGARMGSLREFDSTMHSISIEWDLDGDENHNAESRVRFRKAGTSEWTEFMPLVRIDSTYPAELTQYGRPADEDFDMFAGSILFLTPNTEYEIWLNVEDPDGGSATLVRTIETKPFPKREERCTTTVGPSEFAAAYASAEAGDVLCLENGNYGDLRADRGGSMGRYLALVNAPGASPRFDRIRVETDHLWIEGMTFETPMRTGSVRTTDGDLEEHVVVIGNTFRNSPYSINVASGRYWYIADNIIEGDDPPAGTISGEGIEFGRGSSGHTVAFNTITKTADGNSYGKRNVDVFGNDIFRTSDDGLEPDFGYANKRYWGNRIRDSYYYALSFQPMYSGPWYFIRNEVRQTEWTRQGRSESSTGGTLFKFNGPVDRFVLLHNTFVTEAVSPISPTRIKPILSTYSRNNLYVVPDSPVWSYSRWSANTAVPASSFYANDWRTDVDYDGFSWSGTYGFSWDGENYADVESFSKAVGIEENAIRFDRNAFASYPTDLRPRAGTPLIDSGAIVLGVNEGYEGSGPDRGAYEYGAEPMPIGRGPAETLRERHAYWELH